MKGLLREGLLKHLRLNEVIDGNCGTHSIKQYMFEDDTFDPFSHIESDSDVITDPIDEKNDCVLGFSNGNSKLEWPYFSLPAGFTCPMATVCKNFAAEPGGKKFSDGKSILKGKDAEFLCYAARAQSQYPPVYKSAHRNFDLINGAKKDGGVEAMARLILKSLRYHGLDNSKVFRIHESGDFYDDAYMKAWIAVASELPGTLFYAYTTSLPFWINNKGSIPKNLKLIASMDKNNAKTIMDNNLRYSIVVYSLEQAKELGLKIDVDDSLAWGSNDNFALLLHGGQHSGTDAAEAMKSIRKTGADKRVKKAYANNRNNKLQQLNNL